jgi:DNA invertase Pin-like site-specific DNA recombinase
MKQPLAISYVRFSTIEQLGGDSIRRQTEATEAYCKKNGLTLTDDYRLKDLGKSAYKGVHRSATGALGQLEKQVEAGKIPKGTVLVVENLDRLSREDIVSAQLLLLNLINKGIEIVALSDNERRYSKANLIENPWELMASIMVMSRAHEESKIKSYRVKESWATKHKLAAQGKHIKVKLPAWLESKGEKYVAIPEKADVIKKIFKLYLHGHGSLSIAGMLNDEKVPNIARDRNGRTDRWNSSYILRLLKAKELIGYYTCLTPEVPNFFPKIISDDDFYTAQAKLKERFKFKGQRNRNPQLFSHLLKCSRCGENVVRSCGGGYRYLQCYGAKARMCKPDTLPVFATEFTLLKIINAAGPTASRLDDKSARQEEEEMLSLLGKVAELETKIVTATKFFKDNPSEAGAKVLREMEEEKKSLAAKYEEKRKSRFLVDHRADWKEVKARLESTILKADQTMLRVIPVSVKMVNGKLEFLRHEMTDEENDMIALREGLKTYVEKVEMDLPNSKVEIHFKNGERIPVEFKQTNSYPRRYFYRTEHSDWIETPLDLKK